MVPEKNELFTGRAGVLEDLGSTLCAVVSREYKRRVALFGIGGVGKTQTALALCSYV
jgi:flagellar biosynthesis GTPase FlhF